MSTDNAVVLKQQNQLMVLVLMAVQIYFDRAYFKAMEEEMKNKNKE